MLSRAFERTNSSKKADGYVSSAQPEKKEAEKAAYGREQGPRHRDKKAKIPTLQWLENNAGFDKKKIQRTNYRYSQLW